MKLTIKYTWDSKVATQRIKCLFRHDWEVYQYCFEADHGGKQSTLVIAFKICKRCAKSKLIHILV